ncbi:hypothetical protein AMTRI_Chr02g259710 [Amborella trichopoda]
MRPPLQGHITKKCEVYHSSDCEVSKHSMQPSKYAPASIKPYNKEVYHSSNCEVSKHSIQPSKHVPASIKPYIKEVYHSSNWEASKHSMQLSEHVPASRNHISKRCTTVPAMRLRSIICNRQSM